MVSENDPKAWSKVLTDCGNPNISEIDSYGERMAKESIRQQHAVSFSLQGPAEVEQM